MGILSNVEPKDVFYFFEEICKIPHGSGNTEQISNYLADFAKQRNLEYYQDEIGNVIIIKEASAGYADHEPVMLQGHMDMVTVKEPQCELDMERDGLCLEADGDWLQATGTSLGGDDGIAVAYGLALLDSTEYKHPRVELVVTVGEEVGMDGARALDVSHLRAKRMINLDSEEEGVFMAGCAGGARVNIQSVCSLEKNIGIPCKIEVCGLKGGHSGAEIHKERGNAICILGRALQRLEKRIDFCICDLQGGVADNAIPISAKAFILITGYENQNGRQKFRQDGFSTQECFATLKHAGEKLNRELQSELAQKDPDIQLNIEAKEVCELEVIKEEKTKTIVALLNSLPHGVQAMSATMPGLVETSLNPGILRMNDGLVSVETSVRSSINTARIALVNQLCSIAYLADANVIVTGEYPGWAYRPDSPLREKMTEVFRQLYDKEPIVQAIHAGVECGLLADKIPDLDCVSIGPDMMNIHTTEEKLSISSTARVWNYLLKLLEVL